MFQHDRMDFNGQAAGLHQWMAGGDAANTVLLCQGFNENDLPRLYLRTNICKMHLHPFCFRHGRAALSFSIGMSR